MLCLVVWAEKDTVTSEEARENEFKRLGREAERRGGSEASGWAVGVKASRGVSAELCWFALVLGGVGQKDAGGLMAVKNTQSYSVCIIDRTLRV